MSDKTQHNNILLAVLGLIAAIVVVGLIGFFTLDEKEEIVQGEVEVSEFRVSCKLPGRVAEIRVKEGDYVHVGDTLAIIRIDEVDAQLKVAEASKDIASAMSNMAENGARKELITTAENAYNGAKALYDAAEATYNRSKNLYDEGVLSAQKFDEAKAAYYAAQAQMNAAKSQYDMAKNGSRSEEKTAAEKQVEAAQGAIEVVQSLLNETVQIATVDGEVSAIYPHEGELLGLGSPIMSISMVKDVWGVFHVREDQLNGMKIGSTIKAYVPAFDKELEFKITSMKDAGSYAVWKATKANGQYDLKTFEIKAEPTKPFDGLRPGMSLIVRK